MPGRTSSFIALTIAAVLLLTSIPADRAAAGDDLLELWNKYQETKAEYFSNYKYAYPSRELLRIHQLEFDNISSPINPEFWLFPERYETALNNLNDSQNYFNEIRDHNNSLLEPYHEAQNNYIAALSAATNAAAEMPGPEGIGQSVRKPPPITVKKPPPRKRRRGPVKTTRRPQRPHSADASYTAEALLFLGLSAINRYSTSRGTKKGSRSGSRGGSRGGGVKSPGGEHSSSATTHQDRIRQGM